MTRLTYDCTEKSGNKVNVTTWAEAEAIKAAGGSYKAVYSPIEEPVYTFKSEKRKRVKIG